MRCPTRIGRSAGSYEPDLAGQGAWQCLEGRWQCYLSSTQGHTISVVAQGQCPPVKAVRTWSEASTGVVAQGQCPPVKAVTAQLPARAQVVLAREAPL